MIEVVQANALNLPIADNTVQMCVTSPPYYGLRDYGTAKWIGGREDCDHNPQKPDGGDRSDRSLPLGRGGLYTSICAKCGAIRIDNQLGLEQTPQEYIANMVRLYREVWRVMKDDGTLWIVIGDSYASGKGTCYNPGGGEDSLVQNKEKYPLDRGNVSTLKQSGLKPKDLIGIPWMLAFALRNDGWYLRQEIIWHKPNPMPESVTDRCTKAHESLFLLAKSPRYYFDADAIREPGKYNTDERVSRAKNGHKSEPNKKNNGIRQRKPAGRDTRQGAHGSFHREGRAKDIEYTTTHSETRNKRSVWTIATKPYKGAHFATFPDDLVIPCVKAGSKAGDTVLDPFNGSGTVGEVCARLERNYIGTDLSMDYIGLTKTRWQPYKTQPLLWKVTK